MLLAFYVLVVLVIMNGMLHDIKKVFGWPSDGRHELLEGIISWKRSSDGGRRWQSKGTGGRGYSTKGSRLDLHPSRSPAEILMT